MGCEFQPLFSGNLLEQFTPSLVHTHSRALCRAGPCGPLGSLWRCHSPLQHWVLGALLPQSHQTVSPVSSTPGVLQVLAGVVILWRNSETHPRQRPRAAADLSSVASHVSHPTLTRPVLLSFWDQSSVAHQSLLPSFSSPSVWKSFLHGGCEFFMAGSGKRVNPEPVTQVWLEISLAGIPTFKKRNQEIE